MATSEGLTDSGESHLPPQDKARAKADQKDFEDRFLQSPDVAAPGAGRGYGALLRRPRRRCRAYAAVGSRAGVL